MRPIIARGLVSRAARNDETPIVEHVDLDAVPGQLTVLVGPSGVGKSTLLDIVTGITVPRAGTVHCGDDAVHPGSRRRRARLRARTIATARQQDDLIDALSLVENVLLGQRLARRPDAPLALHFLRAVGLTPDLHNSPAAALSGGERKRTALARALATGSPVVVCDEPTSALDAEIALSVRSLLRSQADGGRTVVAATHDPELVRMANRVVSLAPRVTPAQRSARRSGCAAPAPR